MRSLLPSAALLAGAVLVISGCQEPVSPELTPTEGPLLHMAPAAFSTTVTIVGGIQNPECITFPPEGGVVFEGCIVPEIVEGDISSMDGTPAPVLIVFDQELDATGNGEFEAIVTFGEVGALACVTDPSGATLCGIFEAELEADIIAGAPFAGTFKLEGISGDVEGVKAAGTSDETAAGTGIFIVAGTIRFPEGEDEEDDDDDDDDQEPC